MLIILGDHKYESLEVQFSYEVSYGVFHSSEPFMSLPIHNLPRLVALTRFYPMKFPMKIALAGFRIMS